jgi:hypothetical protein
MSQDGGPGASDFASLTGPSLQALAGNGHLYFASSACGRQCPGTPHSISSASGCGSANNMGAVHSPVAQAQPPTVAGYFRCASCDADCPMRVMKFRGNQKICQPDVNNYAALVGRWKQSKKLKEWWANFSSVVYQETTQQMATGSRYILLRHIPLVQFIRVKFAEGVNRPMAIVQFNEIVSERRASCVYENGEWHVPDYIGIESAVGTQSSSGWAMTRAAEDVRDPAALKAIVQAGAQLVSQSRGSDIRALQSHMPAALADAPVIQRNPAESTAFADSSSIFQDQITMEVHLRIMSSRSEVHETMVM